MKTLKKLIALVLACLMVAALAGCHKKNEIAVTIGEYKFTSAYYMCALMAADSEAKSKVDEKLTEEDKANAEIDYHSKKIDGKKFEKWVKDRTIENLKEIAAYKKLCKEAGISLDKETAKNIEANAESLWVNGDPNNNIYPYSYFYEPNGVSKETYIKYAKDLSISTSYFDHLYNEGGKKEIAKDDIRTKIVENFVVADVLHGDYTNVAEEEKATLKTKFEGYAEKLTAGDLTFEEAYNEHYGPEAAAEVETEEGNGPKDKYAYIFGSKETDYESEYYETLKDMATGEVKVVENEDGSGIVLLVKQDITADEYYFENLDGTTRHLIADDEFEKDIKEYAKKLKSKISKYAINQFKVDEIKEPDFSNQ